MLVESGDPARWKKSSYCEAGSCVEVSLTAGSVGVRDSKFEGSPVLRFTAEEWNAFVMGVKSGEFDLV